MRKVCIGLVDWRLPVSGEEAVLLAADIRADGIQLDLGGPGRNPWLDNEKRLNKLRRVLASSGVIPLAVSANILNDIGLTAKKGTTTSEMVRRIILRALNVALKLGANLVFLPCFHRSVIDHPSMLDRTSDVLRWACQEARMRKLLLATENVLAPKELHQLIRRVNAPNLRILFDTGNLSVAGLKPAAILKVAVSILADQIHIKNTDSLAPLNILDKVVLESLSELKNRNFNINTFVLENDYRDGDWERIFSDIKWLKEYFVV